jgi:hypothetical protein
MRSEFSGVVERRDGSFVLMCCRCHRFMRHDDSTAEVIPQYGEPSDPQFEYVHKTCPPKKAPAARK